MSYKELYRESNELVEERLELVMERIGGIASDKASSVAEPYRAYFTGAAEYLLTLRKLSDQALDGTLAQITETDGAVLKEQLYADVQPKGYAKSFANPAYACAQLGEEYGQILAMLSARFHGIAPECAQGNLESLCLYAELFVEIYNCFEDEADLSDKELKSIVYSFMHDNTEVFEDEADLSDKELKSIVYSFMHDNTEVFEELSIRRMIMPEYDYERTIVMDADLSETSYLYRYGRCIGRDEIESARFLNTFSDEEMQSMADTFTEGYRIGFATCNKDISLKNVVEIRYPMGFERMIRFAVKNFEAIGLKSVFKPFSISENKQYEYDHKEDRGLWLDKPFIERRLEVDRSTWEKLKEIAPGYGGPAVIDIFGTEPFAPEQKAQNVKYTERQQQLSVYERSEVSQLINKYIHGEERSFTIIAYPVPAIGDRYSEIFAETVRINTLDYVQYRDMQQKIIDVLDTADCVHIQGTNGNKTDLYVKIYPLSDPAKETAFENCVADVNIPVGEVFTSPVLQGTQGKLHVTQVYLEELNYKNLELDFEDGRIAAYTCTNFGSEAENRKYIEDNVLFHHKTLPMGEFAIGTNTTAYVMARKFDIADKLPILIAEKTGPHFAVGDTCYTYDEDNITYNPDGKAIVARDNEISLLRKEDVSKAYFNCHTDITIPYDELGRITVIRRDGTMEDIIVNGRFVVPGTETLNVPLDELDAQS